MLLMQNLVEQLKELIDEKYINATSVDGKKTGIIGYFISSGSELAKQKRASAVTFLLEFQEIAKGEKSKVLSEKAELGRTNIIPNSNSKP